MFVRKLSPSTRRQFVKWCRHSTALLSLYLSLSFTHSHRDEVAEWFGLDHGSILFDEIYRRNENWNGKSKNYLLHVLLCERASEQADGQASERASVWVNASGERVRTHESTEIKKKLKPIKIILRIELRMSEMYVRTNDQMNEWTYEAQRQRKWKEKKYLQMIVLNILSGSLS